MERRKKTNIMNWRTLLLLAILLPLPTELAAQKKKRERGKAEQPKIEMTFQEKIKPSVKKSQTKRTRTIVQST